jgi:hypothetical protein
MTSTTEEITPEIAAERITMRHVGNRLYPAANVKVRRSWHDAIRDARAGLGNLASVALDEDGVAFLDWLEAELDEGDSWERFGWADEAARESGWEDATEYAREVFGRPDMKVWSDGRSGGWLYTTDLGSLESWERIESGPYFDPDVIAKWVEYEAWAEVAAQDVADTAVDIIYLNVWETKEGDVPEWNPPVSRAGFYA